MGITQDLTPVYYILHSLNIEQDQGTGDVRVTGNMTILNADGEPIARYTPSVTLNDTEEAQLKSFVAGKLQLFEHAEGLTRVTNRGSVPAT